MTKHGTDITWTWWPDSKGETLNPIRGCKWAKAGKHPYQTCAGCYAQTQAHGLVTRFDMEQYRGLTKMTNRGPIWNGQVNFDQTQLDKALRWGKKRTIFLPSMSDLFYKGVTQDMRVKIIGTMVLACDHRWLVLTKRPDQMVSDLRDPTFIINVNKYVDQHIPSGRVPWSLSKATNIWWGTSIEDETTAAWAIPHLRKVPFPGRRWISYEPMFDYVDLSKYINHLDWVVFGGASKQPGFPDLPVFNMRLARSVIDICQAAKKPVFLKQLGCRVRLGATADYLYDKVTLPKHDNHNADPEQWPMGLRVQEFPGMS